MGTGIEGRAFCTECVDKDQEYRDTSHKIDACCSDRIREYALQADKNCGDQHDKLNKSVCFR